MPRADLVDDRLVVETTWNEKTEIKMVPGARWDTQDKVWHVPLTWTACLQLRGVFGPRLEIGPDLAEWAWNERGRVTELIEMREWLIPPASWTPPYTPGRYPFQVVGSAFLSRAHGALLADEMGTGKTVQAVTALAELAAVPALVLCPNSVKEHWARTVRDWSQLRPFVVAGSAVQRRKILAEARDTDGAVVIVNYEAARSMTRLAAYGNVRLARCRQCDPQHGETGVTPARCQAHPKELNAIGWQVVILDEAHRIKDPHSQQTRAAWALTSSPTVRHRWGLTGTPMVNHPDDLWSILRALSPTEFPTRSSFVDRYCLLDYNVWGGMEVVGLRPDTRDEFYAIFDPHFRRVRKAQVLTQLPPKVREVRWVEMTPAQRRAYTQLQETLSAVGDDGTPLVAANVMVARLRQMQYASSSVKAEPAADLADWKVTLVEPSPKLDELEQVLAELGAKPVAVCAQSRQLIEMAAARFDKLHIPYGMITGRVPAGLRDHALTEFQAGKTRVLLFTIAAGGVGLTMTAADTIVFLQRSWSMVDNRQAEDRVHRIGSEVHESVTIIDLVTRDSVEEGQVAKLHEKLQRLEEITRDRLTLVRPDGDVDVTASQEIDQEEEKIMSGDLLT